MPNAIVFRRLAAILASAAVIGLACNTQPPPPIPSGALLGLKPVADGLTSPVKLVPVPDGSGRLFVVDQIGLIRVIDGNGSLRDQPFLDLRDRMATLSATYDERGLLGLAFHPNYESNGKFYVFYSAPPSGLTPPTFNCENRVSQFFVSSDVNRGDATTEKILLRIQKPQFNHNGGDIAFGPDDFLYIGTGDGGAANDVGIGHATQIGNAQDKTSLLGKILRIDVNNGDPYGIPADNPFATSNSARREIWAWGFRNPYRFSFDLGPEHRFFVGDVGQNLFEEVDIVEKGGNYGWNVREGHACFDPNQPNSPPAACDNVGADGSGLTGPILDYPHDDPAGGPAGISVIGGNVYRGAGIPDLAGRYVFGDLARSGTTSGSLFVATKQLDNSWGFVEVGIAGNQGNTLNAYLFGTGQDSNGEIYLLTSSNIGPSGTTGRVWKITAP